MFTIAIDGPSGAGKSTTAKMTARALGCSYLDTGAMYRAVAAGCMATGIGHDDPEGITTFCKEMNLDISTDPNNQYVMLNGADVTTTIRLPEVTAWVSAVSTIPACREELVRRQQEVLQAGSFVAEGRDITTVVAPNAEVRILLTADPEVRMARRGAELDGALDLATLQDQILRRDNDDSALVNFCVAADGVVTIDSTLLTLAEVVAQVLLLADRAGIHPRVDLDEGER